MSNGITILRWVLLVPAVIIARGVFSFLAIIFQQATANSDMVLIIIIGEIILQFCMSFVGILAAAFVAPPNGKNGTIQTLFYLTLIGAVAGGMRGMKNIVLYGSAGMEWYWPLEVVFVTIASVIGAIVARRYSRQFFNVQKSQSPVDDQTR